MPKSTHSSTRVAHRGPRHESDPDRRVKYDLRFKRKGDEVTPETVIVRRHRRSKERKVAPSTRALLDRLSRRRRRHEAKERLDVITQEFNATGEVLTPPPPAA